MIDGMILEEPVSFTNKDGDILAGVLHHPPAGQPLGAVILCHGMESNKNSEKLVLLSRSLAQRGILTLRFDFRYVGESRGKFAGITYGGGVGELPPAYWPLPHPQPREMSPFRSAVGGT